MKTNCSTCGKEINITSAKEFLCYSELKKWDCDDCVWNFLVKHGNQTETKENIK